MCDCTDDTEIGQAKTKLDMIRAILDDKSVIFNVYFEGKVTLGMKDPDCDTFLVVNCDFKGKGKDQNVVVKHRRKKNP